MTVISKIISFIYKEEDRPYKYLITPSSEGNQKTLLEEKEKEKNLHLLQQLTCVSCGPTASAMLLMDFDLDLRDDEEEEESDLMKQIINLIFSSSGGCWLHQLMTSVKSKIDKSNKNLEIMEVDIKQELFPSVYNIAGHFVVMDHILDDYYYYRDPYYGKIFKIEKTKLFSLHHGEEIEGYYIRQKPPPIPPPDYPIENYLSQDPMQIPPNI